MKAYVNYYDTDGARARETVKADDIRDDEVVVQFNADPNQLKLSQWEAAVCADLNRARVQSKKWPGHVCQLEVEQVAEYEYVIVCNNHPDF